MSSRLTSLLATLLLAGIAPMLLGQDAPPPRRLTEPVVQPPLASSVRVALRPEQTSVPVGSEVVVEFVVQNLTDEPIKLLVPGALEGKERVDYGAGLPLEHVFSASDFVGLEIASEDNPLMGQRVTRKPEYPVPPVTLAPFGTVGLRFDVARFYPGLHQSGLYRLGWRPYGGAVQAEPITIEVVQYKQVVLETDYGTMAIQLLYDRAPKHIANFLDLVERRFYNGKTFHIIYRDHFVLGGCPNGDGTGRRPDGLCLDPEFNATPFEIGTVGMALIAGNPRSGSCQFFICLGREPGWDGKYTAFGQIAGPQSLAVLRRLGETQTDGAHRPTKPVYIKSMSAVDAVFVPTAGR